MNKLIDRIESIRAIVYAGKEYIFSFPTSYAAWEYLSNLVVTTEEGKNFPKEVYIALVTDAWSGGLDVPQIGQVTFNNHDYKLEYHDLFGERYEEFRDKIKADWPTIAFNKVVSKE